MRFATVEIDPVAAAQMEDRMMRDILRQYKRDLAKHGYFAVIVVGRPGAE